MRSCTSTWCLPSALHSPVTVHLNTARMICTSGYVAVSGLLPGSLISQAMAEISLAADSGLGFPSPKAPGCNTVALHPRLTDAARQLLGSTDLRLLDSAATESTSSGSGAETLPFARMSDTQSLLGPSGAGAEAAYAVVLLGESAAVALLDQGDQAEGQWAASETQAAAEGVVARGGPGTVLFVRSEQYHCTEGATQRIGFRKAHASWVQGNGAGFGLVVSGMPRDWMASLSVGQRTLLGFPQPGSPYWTDDTIHAVSHHCAFGRT